jgi:hypothetical protein
MIQLSSDEEEDAPPAAQLVDMRELVNVPTHVLPTVPIQETQYGSAPPAVFDSKIDKRRRLCHFTETAISFTVADPLASSARFRPRGVPPVVVPLDIVVPYTRLIALQVCA